MNTNKKNSNALPFNIDGKYFVDDNCDGCGQCLAIASENLTFDQSDVFCYIYKQPENPADEKAMDEAKKFCPQCAIQTKGDKK